MWLRRAITVNKNRPRRDTIIHRRRRRRYWTKTICNCKMDDWTRCTYLSYLRRRLKIKYNFVQYFFVSLFPSTFVLCKFRFQRNPSKIKNQQSSLYRVFVKKLRLKCFSVDGKSVDSKQVDNFEVKIKGGAADYRNDLLIRLGPKTQPDLTVVFKKLLT